MSCFRGLLATPLSPSLAFQHRRSQILDILLAQPDMALTAYMLCAPLRGLVQSGDLPLLNIVLTHKDTHLSPRIYVT